MNRTTEIKQELLDAAHSGRDLDPIMRRHGRTKGPFYKALAEATDIVRAELSDHSRALTEAQQELEALWTGGESLRAEGHRIQTEIAEARKDIDAKHQQLAELRALGFKQEHLHQLHELLSRTAADQGELVQEGIAQFFATVARYGEIASWELARAGAQTKAKQAQAEAKRWQAEARQREADAKARGSLISITERLLDAGITEGDLRTWEDILRQAGSKPEILLQHLKTFGDWGAVFQEGSKQVATVEARLRELQGQVEALSREREQVSAAIRAVRDGALTEVQQMSKSARDAIRALVAQVEVNRKLQVEAASLVTEVQLARALAGEDRELWKSFSRPSVQRLLHGVLKWSLATGYDPKVIPPDLVRKGTLLQSYHKVSLQLLVWWAITGLMTKPEELAIRKR